MNAQPAQSISADVAVASATQHLSRGRADLASPYIDALLQAMPAHQVVRRLNFMRQLLLIEVPASRMPTTLYPRHGLTQDKIDLVAFHVDLPQAPSGIHEQVCYQDVLRLAFRSAALRAPAARRVILTDEATPFPEDVGAHEVVRLPLKAEWAMYERTKAQLAYLQKLAPDRAAVLMDTDIVVNRDPAEAFAQGFDVGLTWRNGFPDAPFNGGLILIGNADCGVKFMRRVLDCYTALAAEPRITGLMDRDIRRWWGDQYALAIVAGYRAFGERTSDGLLLDELKIAYLPCETYNVTLEQDQKYDRDELRRKFFIHFKGNRKAMLSRYVATMAASGF